MIVKPGQFAGEEILSPEGLAYGGGVILRPAQVAAILSSTSINRRGPHQLRDAQRDVHEEVDRGYIFGATRANIPVQFQYVTQDGYKGVLPWEVLPQVPESRPWE